MRVSLAVVSCLVLAGACGGDDSTGRLADAPLPADARLLDAPDDAPVQVDPPAVTVTVTLDGAPYSGITVYFQDTATAPAAGKLTGVDGKAVAGLVSGGYVTVIGVVPPPPDDDLTRPRRLAVPAGELQLSTFVGVQAGDRLRVDVDSGRATQTEVTVTVSMIEDESGNDRTLYTSCGSYELTRRGENELRRRRAVRPVVRNAPGGPVTRAMVTNVTLRGCGPVADLMAVASLSGTSDVQGWQYKPAAALENGVTVIEFTGLDEATTTRFSYPNLRSTVDRVRITRELRTRHGRLFENATDTSLEDGEHGAALAMPAPEGALAVTSSVEQLTAEGSQSGVIEWGQPADYVLDFAAVALHRHTSAPELDTVNHLIGWSAAVEGADADYAIATIDASRSDGESSQSWRWRIVGPYNAATPAVQFPTLPTDLYDFNVQSTDSPSLAVRTIKSPGGYQAARAVIFAGDEQDLARGVDGATGSIVFEEMYTPEPPPGDSLGPRSVKKLVAPRERARSARRIR